jgi:integrase
MNYRHYAPIVEFWFFTGCRPSEAISLTWGNVSDDCSVVIFNGSIQTLRGVQVRSELSKNNKVRSLAVSLRVQELLKSRRPLDADPLSLVFPSLKGKAINYPNFLTKVWGKIVDPIKPNTTPYNCRDTFFYYASMN